MNIQIEDYFGNDIMKIEYCLKGTTEILREHIEKIEEIEITNGYSIADVDSDENDMTYVRVQCSNVDNSEVDEKQDLINLISKLNESFL